jgi:hypothetical protein
MKRDFIYILLIAALVLAMMLMDRCHDAKRARLLRELSMRGTLVREGDGHYAQAVPIVPPSAVKAALRQTAGRQAVKQIEGQVAAFATAGIRMADKDDTTGFIGDGNELHFTLTYPDSGGFIRYDGLADFRAQAIRGRWRFTPFPVTFVLTQAQAGWTARVIGVPEYFIVDSIVTRTALPQHIPAVGFVAGVGAGWSAESKYLASVGVGLRWKRMRLMVWGSSADVQVKVMRDF